MTLRAAIDSDRDVVRRWRNHPAVRAASLTQHEIGATEHGVWWHRALHDDSSRVLIYERDGVASGVVTFSHIDPATRTAWWGYYLDNEGLDEREGTLRAWMEIQREAVAHADEVLDLDVLESEVIEANTGVLSFNRRNGFESVATREADVDGRRVPVVTLRRRRGSAPARTSTAEGGTR